MATTINSGDEKKFISLANLKKFKENTDNTYIKASARAAKNGVASLDANGKVPLEQLANLDTSLFILATELPKDNIKSNKIYLIESTNKGADNEYTEYVYVDSAWEKLGEYKANVDLAPYLKIADASTTYLKIADASTTYLTKSTGVTQVGIDSTNLSYTVNNKPTVVTIPVATKNTSGPTGAKGHNGFMTADQATELDTATSNISTITSTVNKLTSRYPFGIASFKVANSVIEVGTSNTLTASWSYSNTDFHPLKSQTIQVNSDAKQTIGNTTFSWQKTGVVPTAGTDRVKYTFTLTAVTNDNITKTSSFDVYAVHASFVGVTTKTSLTAAEVIALRNKAIINGIGRTVTVNQSNQRMVIAYPSYLGDLTSVKDANGFQGINGYVKSTVGQVNGTTYNVYIQNTPATANGTYTIG